MQLLSSLLWGNVEKCREHGQEVFWVCYDARCSNSHFICKDQHCNQRHQGHKLSRYHQYKDCLTAAEKHVKIRQELLNNLLKYQCSIINYVEKLVQEMKVSLFSKLNKHCSPKFLEFQKIYKNKADFVPLLYQFEEIFPEEAYDKASSMLSQKHKNIFRAVSKQELNFQKLQLGTQKGPQAILRVQKATEMKIKQVLPFKCDLKLKFKASNNQFLSKNMHSLNLRGPIVLYVKSHKNHEFGGYSSIMFPKYEEEENMENRNITAFLFSIDYAQVLPLKDEYKKYAIKGGINFGFGRGDLLISDQCHKGNISWAQIGRAYKEPSNIKCPLNQWLAGASYYRVLEYEIYAVQSKREK